MHKWLFSAVVALALTGFRQSGPQGPEPVPFADARERAWVDSVFSALSLDERIGQLFMLRAHSDRGPAFEAEVAERVRKYKPGGLCFFQGTPERQAELTNWYQSLSSVPLMISMDAEWGLGHRLESSTISFPKQMMLGALQNDSLIYLFGLEAARELRRLGVHVSFSPVVDVNCNSANPVINYRSFGESPTLVAAKAFAYMMGLRDGGVMACAKHFPGHGDTNVDSHNELPLLPFNGQRLDSLELLPFRALIQHGIEAVMVGHLEAPAIDATAHLPASLSQKAVDRLLRKSLGFEGLVFTDGLEMDAVRRNFRDGEASLRALEAGNDVLLVPKNLDAAFDSVKTALANGRLAESRVESAVKRILRAKFRLGLRSPQRVVLDGLRSDLNAPEAFILKKKLIENALVLVRDDLRAVPFGSSWGRTACLALGADGATVFQKTMALLGPVELFWSKKDLQTQAALLDTLRSFQTVVVSLHQTRTSAANNFGLTDPMKRFVEQLVQQNRVVLVPFGSPYSLQFFDAVPAVLLGFTEDEMAQTAAAEALFGAIPLSGKMPVTASPSAAFGQGLTTKALPRLRFALPEEAGFRSDSLKKLDDLAAEMIAEGAAPGCQILVARNGKIVWNKAYGWHDYSRMRPVETTDVYDLASVTKIMATTLAVMRLHERGQLDISQPMSRFVPELAAFSDKKDLTVERLMAHHGGLAAWIPFYKSTLTKSGLPDPAIYQPAKTGDFTVEVAQNLWMRRSEVDSIWAQIFRSKVSSEKKYVYSDLDFLLAARAVENVSGQSISDFARQNFYEPLGLAATGYRPLERLAVDRCVPTEIDGYFRHQTLQGYVHDMGAAQLGGIAGHAGLFSNAIELASIMQMLLNGGELGGQRFFEKKTVERFTTRFEGSTRRGIGFDMKELDRSKTQNMSELAGPNTWGHMGFTGNAVWADPDDGLIFIFLSNRTMPTMENNKLINGNFRPRAQSIVYRAMR